ncbi:MAG: SMP-30/gluconolactonase/LRE family protein [Planctomycetaceae bacterium]
MSGRPGCCEDGTVYFSDIVGNRILRSSPAGSGLRGVPPAQRPCEWTAPRSPEPTTDLRGERVRSRRRASPARPAEPRRRRLRSPLRQLAGTAARSPNDVACSSDGHIFFTDPCYGDRSTMQLDHDSVYHIDPSGHIDIALSQPDIQRPNGIHLSPDQRTLYVVDSCPVVGGNRKLWAFELNGRMQVGRQRCVYDFAAGRGGDGMTVDSEGRLYVAAGIHRPRGPHETTDVPPGIYILTPAGAAGGPHTRRGGRADQRHLRRQRSADAVHHGRQIPVDDARRPPRLGGPSTHSVGRTDQRERPAYGLPLKLVRALSLNRV